MQNESRICFHTWARFWYFVKQLDDYESTAIGFALSHTIYDETTNEKVESKLHRPPITTASELKPNVETNNAVKHCGS